MVEGRAGQAEPIDLPQSTGHAGRQERPTFSAGQILILRLPLTVGPFFCFFFPLGLCTIPLPRSPLGDIFDLGRR